ncbi:MAG: 50S ribosomal protein L32 [Desulfobacterales bacterium]|nr:50S ribosomal protein L32 [Desulfobulbaceae bacterium]MDX2433370.1 50S ribosomal protein L32 [Desulfobacterales bacterium]NOQ67623.1 50S ribosomal protein L32 [Desulfobacterales bacterium]
MALPKHRHSHSRTRKRRSHDALTPAVISSCPKCGEPKISHRLCSGCGTYNGRTVIKLDAELE